MKKLLFATILCMAILTGCGHTEPEQSTAEQPVTTLAETATTESVATTVNTTTTMEGTTTAPAEPEYTENDIKSVRNWLTEIWNICVDIESYAHTGTDCTGKEMDFDFFMKGSELKYRKRDEYDAIVHALDDSVPEQEMYILSWEKCMEQVDSLLGKAFSEPPSANDESYEFNLDLLRQYFEQLRTSETDMMYEHADKVVLTEDDKKELIFKK